MDFAPPTLILVEPQQPANVGFIARVAENFGLGEVRVLGPWDPEHPEARRTGSPAPERLAGIRAFDSWQDAAAGCSHLIGFTARAGRRRAPISILDWEETLASWGEQAQVGLVFGREDRGLENEEVERCSLLVSIPTMGLGSLNLSHAVAVAGHAWRRFAGGTRMPTPPGTGARDPEAAGRAVADQADRLRFAETAAAAIADIDFRDPPAEVEATLRRLAALPIETRDLRILDRVLRHVQWRRERSADD